MAYSKAITCKPSDKKLLVSSFLLLNLSVDNIVNNELTDFWRNCDQYSERPSQSSRSINAESQYRQLVRNFKAKSER